MSCGVGHRCSSDMVLLWLWYKLAAAALIQSLAWELPYAVGVAPQRQKKKKEESNCSSSGHWGGVGSIPAWSSGSKDLGRRSQLQIRFNPCLGTSIICHVFGH